MFVARKIGHAKWKRDPLGRLSADEISADAVTADLRTRENALSFWRCGGGTLEEVGDVVLAIAAGRPKIERLDVVWLDLEQLTAEGHRLCATPGDTRVSDLVDQHVDVQCLDYVRLGDVARRVAAAIKEGRFKRFRKGEVRTLLINAVRDRRLDVGDLSDKVRSAVQARLAL